MSSDKATKTVFRMLWAWNDENEERWLEETERSGWHLKAVRGFGYTFEKGPPSEVAYRWTSHPRSAGTGANTWPSSRTRGGSA